MWVTKFAAMSGRDRGERRTRSAQGLGNDSNKNEWRRRRLARRGRNFFPIFFQTHIDRKKPAVGFCAKWWNLWQLSTRGICWASKYRHRTVKPLKRWAVSNHGRRFISCSETQPVLTAFYTSRDYGKQSRFHCLASWYVEHRCKLKSAGKPTTLAWFFFKINGIKEEYQRGKKDRREKKRLSKWSK